MAQTSPAFGTLLRRLRVAAGLSQEALAERARVSPKGVSSLELGTRLAPYRATVDQLLTALEATPEECAELLTLAEQARSRRRRIAPLPATDTPITNLVSPPTRLIGRNAEVSRATELISASRLLTLTGPGGVGKTRVAQGTAREAALRFRDGIWFVYLAPLSDLDSVARTVAVTLGMPEKPGSSSIERVTEFLRGKESLLILDNCEHLLAAVAQFVRVVLAKSQNVRFLTTSREALRTAGEVVFKIPTLRCPPRESSLTLSQASDYSAMELFIDRACASDASVAFDDESARAIGRIVRRLDGLPLAIELAAARVGALGLTTIERRLSQRFELLSRGDRIAPARQQTLRALIAWSYDLLAPSEQLLFRRLSVFVGGCSLEAAELVCGDGLNSSAVESLASLVDKSLVSGSAERTGFRYHFLESTREFAHNALSPVELSALAYRHALWVAEVLEKASLRAATDGTDVRFAAVLPELDNIRAALEWCACDGDVVLGGRIASHITDLFFWHALAEEGRNWIQRFLNRLNEDDHLEVVARLYCGLARLTGDTATRMQASQRALELAERSGTESLLIAANQRFAVALYAVGRLDEALAASDRAITIARRVLHPTDQRVAWALQHRSWMLCELGELDAARGCLEEAIGIFRQLKADREAWTLCGDLAELEFAAGHPELALQIIDDAIPVVAEAGDPVESVFMCNRAGYLLSLSDFTEAEATAREAVELAEKTHSEERVLHALEHLAAALASRSELTTAALLGGFVAAGYSKLGYQRETNERSSHEILTSALGTRLSQEDAEALTRRGAEMSGAQALEAAAQSA
ncbi:MAG TPA: tetratricopeptide repeat protein [Candidatus Cybelea sp.]|jgi:predicted ATPase/DNA-binding XRE family transcriptional regulator|nr:tetratricopeptide repeat protein [Candidatus Cybelea sp.]